MGSPIFLYFCNPTAARAFTIAGRIQSYTQYYLTTDEKGKNGQNIR